jgi:hypothetical protein
MDLSRSKPMNPMQDDEPIVRGIVYGRRMINTYSTNPDDFDPECMDRVGCIDDNDCQPAFANNMRTRPNIRAAYRNY